MDKVKDALDNVLQCQALFRLCRRDAYCIENCQLLQLTLEEARTLDGDLKFLVHHALHNVLNVIWMRVACAIIDCRLVCEVVGGMAGLHDVERSTHVTSRELHESSPAIFAQLDSVQHITIQTLSGTKSEH